MTINIGGNNIESIYVGSNKIGKIYVGSNLVYQSEIEPTIADNAPYVEFNCKNPFKLSIYDETNGAQWSLSKNPWYGTIQYSTNGSTWTTWSSATTTLSSGVLNNRNIIRLRGIGNEVLSMRSINNKNHFANFRVVPDDNKSLIWGLGNLGALIDYSRYTAGTMATTYASSYKYTIAKQMFKNNTFLKTPLEMPPLKTLASNSFWECYYGCTNLIRAPKRFPATSIGYGCYYQMFRECTNLVEAPESIDTQTMTGTWAMTRMFYNCKKLKGAVKFPNLTTITDYGCYYMFYNCTWYDTFPILKATSIGNNGCEGMFKNTNMAISDKNLSKYNFTIPYRIPATGTGTVGTNSLTGMFPSWSGNWTFSGTPSINTTYYIRKAAV